MTGTWFSCMFLISYNCNFIFYNMIFFKPLSPFLSTGKINSFYFNFVYHAAQPYLIKCLITLLVMNNQELIWDTEYKNNRSKWKKDRITIPSLLSNKKVLEIG